MYNFFTHIYQLKLIPPTGYKENIANKLSFAPYGTPTAPAWAARRPRTAVPRVPTQFTPS